MTVPAREAPAFSVRLNSRGVWEARAYVGTDPVTGRRVRPYRSLPQARSEDEAREYAAAWAATLAPGAAASRRLDDALAEYIDGLDAYGRAAQTVETYRSTLRRQVAPTIGSVRVGDLQPWEVSTAYRILMAGSRDRAPVGRSAVRKMDSLLSGAYDQWCREGLVSSNPVRSATKPSRQASAARAIGEADFARLSRALREAMRGGDPTDRATAGIAFVCLSTGLRDGEACALRRDSLRRLTREVNVSATMTERPTLARKPSAKTRSGGRNVAVDPETYEELTGLMARIDADLGPQPSDAPMVTVDGSFVRPSSQSRRFTALARSLGLPAGTTMHTLRHTHASMLLYRGVPVETIRARLGHSEVTTTLSLYAHLLEGADRAAANAWEGVAGDVGGCAIGVPAGAAR